MSANGTATLDQKIDRAVIQALRDEEAIAGYNEHRAVSLKLEANGKRQQAIEAELQTIEQDAQKLRQPLQEEAQKLQQENQQDLNEFNQHDLIRRGKIEGLDAQLGAV